MKFKLRFALCFALLMGLFILTPASSESPLTISMSRIDVTEFPTVFIQFSAWDDNGIPLADLTSADIFIREGNLAEIHPMTVTPDSNAALSVALVLDVSGSMEGQPLEDAQNAAYRFLDRLTEKDQAAIIAFSDKVNTDAQVLDPAREVGFSGKNQAAFDLIEGLVASGNTEIYNAMEKAVKMTSELPSGHRAVLLFTDGRNDPTEVGDPENAISLAKEAGIPVFIIGLGNAIDEAYLGRLAAETGGLYRQTPRSSELSDIFYEMATLLKTSYTMSYTSGLNADGGTYPIIIRIDSMQGSMDTTTSIGPLPLAEPTQTPTTAPTSTPTAPITPLPAVIVTPEPEPVETAWQKYQTPLILGGLLILVALANFMSKKKQKIEEGVVKCANCGAVLSEPGPCPICRSTKRIKTRKE